MSIRIKLEALLKKYKKTHEDYNFAALNNLRRNEHRQAIRLAHDSEVYSIVIYELEQILKTKDEPHGTK